MKQLLIFITDLFPYAAGETFIENEIQYLAAFDRIMIFPCETTACASSSRMLPNEKFQAFPMPVLSGFKKIVSSLYWRISAMARTAFWLEFGRLLFSGRLTYSRFVQLHDFIRHGERCSIFVKKKLQDEKLDTYDRIVIYGYWFHVQAYVAARLKWWYPESTAFCRAHRFDLYNYLYPTNYLPFREWILARLTGVFPVSEDGLNYLKKNYPAYQDIIKCAKLGTTDNQFIDRTESRAKLRIVSCSRVVAVKRIDRIISALAEIVDLDIEWTHIGGGILLADLIVQAANLMPKNIKCVWLGDLANEAVIEFYRNNPVHLFVNVSESEGLPVSIMEAISFGIPVIATNVGGTSEIIAEAENGYLLDRDFALDELARRIHLIADMPEIEYLSLRKNARMIWAENYSAQKNYREFTAILAGKTLA